MTEAERKLAHLIVKISKDRDFCIPVVLLARQENLTDKLINFLEHNTITDEQLVWDWFFSEDGGGIDASPLEIEKDE